MRTLIACLLLTLALRAQGVTTFDAASVKPNQSNSMESEWRLEGGRFTARNVTLKILIASAYGEEQQPLADYQLSGGPNWLGSDRFDVLAKADTNQAAPTSRLPSAVLAMLRALLEERFKLKTHVDTKQMRMYAMVRSNADGTLGPGLRPSAPGTKIGGQVVVGHLSAKSLTMKEIVSGLARFMPDVNRIVIDRTGLTGSFDLDLTWTPDQAAPGSGVDLNAPSLFTAMREQLGLKLESITGPVKILVIDRAEEPSAD